MNLGLAYGPTITSASNSVQATGFFTRIKVALDCQVTAECRSDGSVCAAAGRSRACVVWRCPWGNLLIHLLHSPHDPTDSRAFTVPPPETLKASFWVHDAVCSRREAHATPRTPREVSGQLRVGASGTRRSPTSWGISTRSRPTAWSGRFTACRQEAREQWR